MAQVKYLYCLRTFSRHKGQGYRALRANSCAYFYFIYLWITLYLLTMWQLIMLAPLIGQSSQYQGGEGVQHNRPGVWAFQGISVSRMPPVAIDCEGQTVKIGKKEAKGKAAGCTVPSTRLKLEMNQGDFERAQEAIRILSSIPLAAIWLRRHCWWNLQPVK